MREGVPLPSNNDQLLFVTKAAYFAAQAHREQRRKDEQKTPYINHLTEVAHLLAAAGCEQVVVAAGYLHDTIEDVGVTYEMLHAEFGKAVADLVLAVTDDPGKAGPQATAGGTRPACLARDRGAENGRQDQQSAVTEQRAAFRMVAAETGGLCGVGAPRGVEPASPESVVARAV
jgi:hypothetical protein